MSRLRMLSLRVLQAFPCLHDGEFSKLQTGNGLFHRFRLERLEERVVLSAGMVGMPGDPGHPGESPSDPTNAAGAEVGEEDNIPPDDQTVGNSAGNGNGIDLDDITINDDEPEVFVPLPIAIDDGDSQTQIDDYEIADVSDYELFDLIEIEGSPFRLHIIPRAGASGTATVTLGVVSSDGTGFDVSFEVEVVAPEPAFDPGNSIVVARNGTISMTAQTFKVGVPGNQTNTTFTFERVPKHGVMKLNGQILQIGQRFYSSDISSQKLTYTHDGSNTTFDSFGISFVDITGRRLGIFDVPIQISGTQYSMAQSVLGSGVHSVTTVPSGQMQYQTTASLSFGSYSPSYMTSVTTQVPPISQTVYATSPPMSYTTTASHSATYAMSTQSAYTASYSSIITPPASPSYQSPQVSSFTTLSSMGSRSAYGMTSYAYPMRGYSYASTQMDAKSAASRTHGSGNSATLHNTEARDGLMEMCEEEMLAVLIIESSDDV